MGLVPAVCELPLCVNLSCSIFFWLSSSSTGCLPTVGCLWAGLSIPCKIIWTFSFQKSLQCPEDGKHAVGWLGIERICPSVKLPLYWQGHWDYTTHLGFLIVIFPAFLPTHCAWDYTCPGVHVLHCCVPAWMLSLKNNYFMCWV